MSQPNSSTTTAPSMNSPSLVYNNLPPDHILNKQRSNISIKQINKIQNSSNSTSTNGSTPSSSASIHNNIPTPLNNPLTSISSNNNSIIMLSNNNNNTQQQLNNNTNNNTLGNTNNQMVIGGGGDLIMPPPTVSSSTNSNIHSNNISNNNLLQDVILTNRTQFLLDSSSISNNSNVLFNIRIGNPKQIEMEITKSGNEIKYYNRSCIHDLDSLQRYWSECYRIESEHLNDKPLMYIPITGVINIKLFKNLENPNLEHHLEKKYDFRQSDSLIIPIKFENNIVMVLKLMKMDYVEFIGLQAIDFYLIKQITTNTVLHQQP